MDVHDLIKMILLLDGSDKDHIRSALAVDAAGSPEAMSILDIPMGENDADAATVEDYLKTLLIKLWEDGESFSGKRPFGNSGWEHDLWRALAKAGKVKGDENGYVSDQEERAKANGLIFEAIDQLRGG
jgi:hypothetical protein